MPGFPAPEKKKNPGKPARKASILVAVDPLTWEKSLFTEFDPLYRTYDKQAALRKQKEFFATMPSVAEQWDEYTARFKSCTARANTSIRTSRSLALLPSEWVNRDEN